jgi:hypothetical protein
MKVVHFFMQSSSTDRTTEFLLQRRRQNLGFDESKKADNLALEPILGCFHNLDENQRCSLDPELFAQPDESKRAKKMIELAIPSIFRLR